MNQRLVWNFELSSPKVISSFPQAFTPEELKWEIRYFWPENHIIPLYAIDSGLGELTHYKQKYKEDIYFLLPDCNYNIKFRRQELLYKPLLNKTDKARGFGPKVNLANSDILPLQKIHDQVQKQGIQLFVTKSSFIYTFKTTPQVKLELAKLTVNNTVFFSMCIEGKSLQLVEKINEQIVDKQPACDYVHFLKSIIKL